MVFKAVLGLLLFALAGMAEEKVSVLPGANNVFASKIGSAISKIVSGDNNWVASPLSAHQILSLLYQGSEGDTKGAFEKVLHVPSKDAIAQAYLHVNKALNETEAVDLDLANKVYLKTGYVLNPDFGNEAKDYFSAGVELLDFAKNVEAAKTINSWVENETHDKIKDLVSSSDLDDSTRLVLVNAVYLNASWAKRFEKKDTSKRAFYLNNKDEVEVDTMHIISKYRYAQIEELNSKVVELPYKDEKFSMLIILPNDKDGLPELENKLADFDLGSLGARLVPAEVDLYLPKFKIESSYNLKAVLSELGLPIIFTDKADLPGLITSGENLKVSEVVQKAFIEVNEEGTEASAATDVVVVTGSHMPDQIPEVIFMTVDHPFAYYLTNVEAGPLFSGCVYNPLSKN